MRVVTLSAYDHNGGGSIAALRLHRGLRRAGVNADMLVQGASSGEDGVAAPKARSARLAALLRPDADQIPLRRYRSRRALFSPAWLPDGVAERVAAMQPDLVHVHWINGGFMRVESLRRLGVPLVWTMHDMWAFTGGCHYDEECGRYRSECGGCPVLASKHPRDLAARGQRRKRRVYQGLDLTLVAPSNWMARCVRASSLLGGFDIRVIPNALDLERFQPVDSKLARSMFGLPADRPVVLFGAASANDTRKGFLILQDALRSVSRTAPNMVLVVFGASAGPGKEQFGIETRYVGRLRDEVSMALLYNAADVFVVPSLQDNLPNTLAEALACGTPCVGFDTGGIADLIDHRRNGYLSRARDADDLARGIDWTLRSAVCMSLRQRARQSALERLDAGLVTQAHVALYEEVLRVNSRDRQAAVRKAGASIPALTAQGRE